MDIDTLEVLGIVTKVMGNNNYSVEIGEEEEQKRTLLCYIGGKMKKFRINIIAGDVVTLEVPPPYDKGRITFRGKKEEFVRGGKKKNNRKKPKGKGGRR